MNQQQLLAQIAELRKVYRALGEITELNNQESIEGAQFHISLAIRELEWVIQDNYGRQQLREEVKRLIRQNGTD